MLLTCLSVAFCDATADLATSTKCFPTKFVILSLVLYPQYLLPLVEAFLDIKFA